MCQHQAKTDLSPPPPSKNSPDISILEQPDPNYLDHIDKPHNGSERKKSNNGIDRLYQCHHGWLHGECGEGHHLARAMMCDKEYCPDCGKKDSIIHKRRVNRWWDRIMDMKSVGYLVITIPEEFRDDFYNKKLLSAFRIYIKRKLEGDGFDKGLMRWHWAGSCKHCRERGCEKCDYTGMSSTWNPHLNVLIENGYEPFVTVPENWINRYKQDIALQMCRLINQYRIIEKAKQHAKDLNCDFEKINLNKIELRDQERAKIDNIVLHYKYSEQGSKKIHWNKYVNRATWRYIKGFREVETIYKHRTTQSWGKKPEPKEKASEEVALENGCCPECEKKSMKSEITWGSYVSLKNSDFGRQHINKSFDTGYFLLDLPPPVDPEYEKMMKEFDYTGALDKEFKGKYMPKNN